MITFVCLVPIQHAMISFIRNFFQLLLNTQLAHRSQTSLVYSLLVIIIATNHACFLVVITPVPNQSFCSYTTRSNQFITNYNTFFGFIPNTAIITVTNHTCFFSANPNMFYWDCPHICRSDLHSSFFFRLDKRLIRRYQCRLVAINCIIRYDYY